MVEDDYLYILPNLDGNPSARCRLSLMFKELDLENCTWIDKLNLAMVILDFVGLEAVLACMPKGMVENALQSSKWNWYDNPPFKHD